LRVILSESDTLDVRSFSDWPLHASPASLPSLVWHEGYISLDSSESNVRDQMIDVIPTAV
jgi:hypothetical protein